MWVEVRYRARRSGYRGPKGVSTSSCQRLSMQIIRTRRVRFILAIILHHVHHCYILCDRLGIEVEAFREVMGNSSLGCRVRVG